MKTNITPPVLKLQDNECLLEGNLVSSHYISLCHFPFKSFVFKVQTLRILN